LKEIFVLTNTEVGWIGGAALWGFSITIFIFGPLCDVLGMKLLLRLAFFAHFLGVIIMIIADGFTLLFMVALILAMGNGLVEAAANPLVATLYPDKKTEMLNKFHVWFPGGIVIGGLISF
jgi:fucose permease